MIRDAGKSLCTCCWRTVPDCRPTKNYSCAREREKNYFGRHSPFPSAVFPARVRNTVTLDLFCSAWLWSELPEKHSIVFASAKFSGRWECRTPHSTRLQPGGHIFRQLLTIKHSASESFKAKCRTK